MIVKRKNSLQKKRFYTVISASVLAAALFAGKLSRGADRRLLICFAVGLSYMSVGILDDFLKMRKKEIDNMAVRNMLLGLALPFVERVKNKEFSQKILDLNAKLP